MKTKRNYYLVIIEKDMEPDKNRAANYAIAEARERARLFIIPCTWVAKRIGQTPAKHVFRVVRHHRA